MKPVLPFAEIMITQACNLSCAGCSNYSDLPQKGWLSWQSGRQEIRPWLERVDIADFGILGGEPLMNPEVSQWITGLRELLPQAQLRFTTNAVLLPRNMHIIDELQAAGNAVFKITVHQDSPEIEQCIKDIFDRYVWEPVQEHGIDRWRSDNNLRFQINRPKQFVKTYQNSYNNMRPWHSSPDQAFELCSQQTCPLLYQGKLYKCSSNGLLPEVLKRFGWPNFEEWQRYLDPGLSADCSDEQLISWLNNFGKPNKVCGMCPSAAHNSVLDHIATVQFQKQRAINE